MPRTKATMTADQVEAELNAHFKTQVIKRASDPSLAIERIPTSILALDWALAGGIARNRHTELYGNANVGKTATSYRLIASAQQMGLTCAFMDVEDKFDGNFAESQGVDLRLLKFTHHEHGHRVFDVMTGYLQSGTYDVVVLDSIASLLPKQELEASMEDGGGFNTYQARLMSQALRRLTTVNRRTACLYINQLRENIQASQFGKRTVTSGGRAMGFYAATRIEMARIETLKRPARNINPTTGKVTKQDMPYGHRILVRIEKEQTGAAQQGDTTTMVFDYTLGGFDPIEDLIYLGLYYELVHGGEAWWVTGYEDEKVRGREAFKKWLRRNRAIAQELEELITNWEGTQEDGQE